MTVYEVTHLVNGEKFFVQAEDEAAVKNAIVEAKPKLKPIVHLIFGIQPMVLDDLKAFEKRFTGQGQGLEQEQGKGPAAG